MMPVFALSPGQTLTLASTSPRRRQLLETLGLPFSIFAPNIQEPSPKPGDSPGDFALACAAMKASACEKALQAPTNIISCDTIVVIDELILGKPENEAQALEMLMRLNGATHVVFSCFCILMADGHKATGKCHALVHFHKWPPDILKAYAGSGESLDKAGGYAIQGRGSFLVKSIEGSWTTVVGLPMAEITAKLLERGIITAAI